MFETYIQNNENRSFGVERRTIEGRSLLNVKPYHRASKNREKQLRHTCDAMCEADQEQRDV